MSKEITLNNFKKEVLEATKPVLVKFYAPWCSACQTLEKVTEGIETDLQNKAHFKTVDIDKEKELAKVLNIMSVPALVVFNNGRIINSHVGLLTKREILNLIP